MSGYHGSTPEQRFWRKVRKTDTCWLWTGGKDCDGYGLLNLYKPKTSIGAHRFSWFLAHGVKPDTGVLHRCDVRACVNPDHLFLGNQSVNVADGMQKGKYGRLQSHIVLSIRVAKGTCEEIGYRFDVCPMTVSQIKRKRTWRHI